MRQRGEGGQAAVELVALIPVLVVVVAAVVQVLAAGSARERAGEAAEAGAVAMLQDADPKRAIERALGEDGARASFVVDGRRVRVTVRPRAFAPSVSRLLAATAHADAGREADPVVRTVVRGGDGKGSGARTEAMNELLARAGALFVAPAGEDVRTRPAASARPPDLVGVLARPADLAAAAGGVAAALRARHGTRTALVLLPAERLAARVATRPARVLARRIADRDLAAAAVGCVCQVGLPPDATEHDAWRAIAAAAGVPAIVALPTRTKALDALLAQADELLLAPAVDADPDLTALTLASLRSLGRPAALVPMPNGPIGRRAATLGLRRLAASGRERTAAGAAPC